jgi:hypothetical protein
MSNQTLRELAKDYAKGTIDKDNYRKSRTELITAITAGKITVAANDYPPPLMPSEEDEAITETAKREKTEIAPPPANKPTPDNISTTTQQTATQTNNKSPLMFIAVSAVIVILLIIAVVLFYPKPPGSTSIETVNESNNAKSASVAVPAATNMAGESLIAEFLTQKNWTEESLDMFTNSWSALTHEEQASAKQSKRMQRMHDSIYKQFLEEKALASIDSEKAGMKQQKLIAFATAMGISDSRLVLE